MPGEERDSRPFPAGFPAIFFCLPSDFFDVFAITCLLGFFFSERAIFQPPFKHSGHPSRLLARKYFLFRKPLLKMGWLLFVSLYPAPHLLFLFGGGLPTKSNLLSFPGAPRLKTEGRSSGLSNDPAALGKPYDEDDRSHDQ